MKRTISMLCIAALAGCGGSTGPAPEYPPMPEPETAQGVTGAELPTEPLRDAPVLIEQRSESPIVTVRVVFEAGSGSDPSGREGATALAATLMSEGGAGERSYAQIVDALYPMAAQLGAQVDREQTTFIGRVHRDHVEAFYEIFRDVLLRPQMSAEDFERVKQQMLSALTLELRGNDDETLGKETLQAMLYEGHPFGHPELGTERALTRLTLDDVRAQRARVLCGGRVTIGVAGGYPEGFAPRVARDVGELASEACVGRSALPAPRASESRIWIVDKPQASSVAVSMGMPIDVQRDDEDYPALVLAVAWLGQHRQFVGRLMQSIRERRGMNYGDYAYPEHFEQEGWGVFPLPNIARRQQYFSIWLRPLRPEQAHFGMRLAIAELRNFVENGLDQAELDRIRSYLDGYYALFLQTESRRLGYAIDDAFYGVDRPWLERLRAAWAELTPEQVNAVIRRQIDPARLQIAIVAPDASRLADRIASEQPSPIEYPGRTVPPEVLEQDRVVQELRIGIPRERIRIVPVAQMFAE
ncbi:M16 family metallopeptidase [Sandaracinus amylolyticus]|uniref:M16 family metallopeptidase n=1 Tax=Sandaracinus amylolyticus TaxID=927083 RepID=UPI001F455E7C|nr:pitrilysin family protein [Sandaracinus amylolyticus]